MESFDSLNEWSDNQLLAYLTSLQGEGVVSTSSSDSSEIVTTRNKTGCRYATGLAQPPQQVSSVLDSIKRKLSFGALDELMLLPANKRMHYSDSINEQSSPTSSSSSVDQAFPELII